MTEIEAYGTGHKALIPSEWGEMTPSQVRHIFRLYDECIRKGLSPLDFNVRALYYFMGIRPGLKSDITYGLHGGSLSKAENVYALCDKCLAFLFSDTGNGTATLSFDSVSNPLPYMETRAGKRLYGPGDLLHDLTFGEFRVASSLLNRFFMHSEPEELDRCLAVLYRRRSKTPNKAGRKAVPMDAAEEERSLKTLRLVPAWQKSLAMMWFSACLNYLQKGKVLVDGEEIDMSALFAGETAGAGPSFTWNDLAVQVARDRTIGNRDAVDEEPLFSIFSLMWSNYKEHLRDETNRKP